nr:hypothetical protein [uncultured Celeribacter sp.]
MARGVSAIDAGVRHASVAETVARADVLLLPMHWSRVPDVLEQSGDLAGKVVLNCCVPLDDKDRDLVLARATSGVAELARSRPKARWVPCFNTTPSESLYPAFEAKGTIVAPQVLTNADDDGGKESASADDPAYRNEALMKVVRSGSSPSMDRP